MSAIRNLSRQLWYSTPGKDRRTARKIEAELWRYEQIEKAAQALVKNGAQPETIDALKKALKPLKDEP